MKDPRVVFLEPDPLTVPSVLPLLLDEAVAEHRDAERRSIAKNQAAMARLEEVRDLRPRFSYD